MRMAIGSPARTLRSLAFASLLLGLPSPASASIVFVTDLGDTGGAGQLRSLINAAAPGDTIVIPPGTIVLTGIPGENANATGDLDILKDLTIVGAGAALTVIDANHLDRVFDVASTVTFSVSGLTMRNGHVDPAAAIDPSGGGLLNRGVSTTLIGVVIENNFAGGGGGIANFAGAVTLFGSTVRNNSSTGITANGGGILNFGALEVTSSTISGNTVFGTSSSTLGGGILNTGALTLRDSSIVANSASGTMGGGLYQAGGTMALTNVTIADNQAGAGQPYARGGGLANSMGGARHDRQHPDCRQSDRAGHGTRLRGHDHLSGTQPGSEHQSLHDRSGRRRHPGPWRRTACVRRQWRANLDLQSPNREPGCRRGRQCGVRVAGSTRDRAAGRRRPRRCGGVRHRRVRAGRAESSGASHRGCGRRAGAALEPILFFGETMPSPRPPVDCA